MSGNDATLFALTIGVSSVRSLRVSLSFCARISSVFLALRTLSPLSHFVWVPSMFKIRYFQTAAVIVSSRLGWSDC